MKDPIKLGSQCMVSCYFAPKDYWALRHWSELTLGSRKMATVIRAAMKEYLTARGVKFSGIDPRAMQFAEE